MRTAYRIEPVDHSVLRIARQLHAVQMSAYAQEAQLLGATYFPPLERSVDEVRTSTEAFQAAFIEDEIVGAISVWPDREGMGVNIASLVVAPHCQRRGIGRHLLATVLAEHGGGELTVQTGAKNVRALALYAQAGFVELRRWLVGREPLELVKLCRPATKASE
jgi:ribosomal protein S18 acetylase RimI-like enzyme